MSVPSSSRLITPLPPEPSVADQSSLPALFGFLAVLLLLVVAMFVLPHLIALLRRRQTKPARRALRQAARAERRKTARPRQRKVAPSKPPVPTEPAASEAAVAMPRARAFFRRGTTSGS